MVTARAAHLYMYENRRMSKTHHIAPSILAADFTRLGGFLRELVESTPQIDTELRQGMSGDVLAQVAHGELDIGFHLGPVGDPMSVPAQGQAKRMTEANAFEIKTLSHVTYRVLAPAGWGEQVLGRDWRTLAALPWLSTPVASAHHRMLASVFAPLGLEPRRVALVDQEASMLDLVRSGVGLSLVRDSIAIAEAQARGLVIADKVSLDCRLSFLCLKTRMTDPVVVSAWTALNKVWR